ncbi:MAG TPA: hypothetical protein PKM12_00405, partial [Marmoricola sp.]|nr:hypothetical protein [Marmoricola sp.]
MSDLLNPRNAIAAGGVVLMLGFIWISFDNLIIGIAAIVLLLGVVALVALGYENTTNLLMLAAMF